MGIKKRPIIALTKLGAFQKARRHEWIIAQDFPQNQYL